MEKRKFKILTIDGGGIKGLYSAALLSKFEEYYKVKITDHFDLICGTSTGGLIALGASLGIPMREIVSFYENEGPKIFNENRKRSTFGRLYLLLKQVAFKGKYQQEELKAALTNVFGNIKLKESKNLLCIPSYNINTDIPRVFKKDYGSLREDNEKRYVDVALATTAAPTYFPVTEIDDSHYVDGGIWANNPILVGLFEYLYQFSDDERFNGVEILSISSFMVDKGQIHKKTNRAFIDWKGALFDAYSSGQSKFAMKFIEQLRNRLNVTLDFQRIENICCSPEQASIIDMDNASKESLKLLKTIGMQTASHFQVKPEIVKFFNTTKTINI